MSARHYNQKLREFVASGKVEPAAREAQVYVANKPEEAARAERRAARGPHTHVSLDELLAKGRGVVERVRPIVHRAVDRVRSRLGRK